MLIDSTNDPESAGFKLKYQKNGSGGYIDVPVGSSSASGSDDESFESDFGNWEQDPTNDEDWARNSGPTGSSETGPSSAQSGSYYIYVETSSGSAYFNGDESIIINDFGQNKTGTINFYFHQYGTKQGTLYLDQWNGSSWSNIWSSSGDQGDQWNSVTNQAFTSASKLRFRNVAAGGYRGDVALDNIQIDFIATDNEVYVDTSSSVASGGEATTARLTAPSGKTTGDFTIGRRWDDENGSDSIDIGNGLSGHLTTLKSNKKDSRSETTMARNQVIHLERKTQTSQSLSAQKPYECFSTRLTTQRAKHSS
jgi:hypothetical protein